MSQSGSRTCPGVGSDRLTPAAWVSGCSCGCGKGSSRQCFRGLSRGRCSSSSTDFSRSGFDLDMGQAENQIQKQHRLKSVLLKPDINDYSRSANVNRPLPEAMLTYCLPSTR